MHAKVVADKCLMALPLHRQARALERLGAPIAVSVICGMFHRAAATLRPVYEAILKRTPTMDVVQADETGQPTLAPGTGSVRKAWMWTFVDAQAILFVYSFSRGGEGARQHLRRPDPGTQGLRQHRYVAAPTPNWLTVCPQSRYIACTKLFPEKASAPHS